VRFITSWLPAVVWTVAVLSFSTTDWSAAQTGELLMPMFGSMFPWATPDQLLLVHAFTRKAAHVTEYALLAALWFRGIVRSTSTPGLAAWLSVATSVACAIVDEVHQATIPSRTGSRADVLIDGSAALATSLALYLWLRRRGEGADVHDGASGGAAGPLTSG
jgi:VanZ family protein